MTPNDLEAIRARIAQASALARRDLDRLSTPQPNHRLDHAFASAERRVAALFGDTVEPTPPAESPDPPSALSVMDAHLLEAALSHVLHSVVRTVFYNLKSFAPSLKDEYDDDLRAAVTATLAQLPQARAELDAFFALDLGEGRAVGMCFAEARRAAIEAIDELDSLARSGVPDRAAAADRQLWAESVPTRIDQAMEALHGIQRTLDSNKLDGNALLDDVRALCARRVQDMGATLDTVRSEGARRFPGDRARLLTALAELVENALRHGHATQVTLGCTGAPHDAVIRLYVEDNGRGMTPEVQRRCLDRGFTTGGTGEGLALVNRIITVEHLGQLLIDSAPDHGCRIEAVLPIKLNLEHLETP